jgi:GDPmannose 4,6-dehydratase
MTQGTVDLLPENIRKQIIIHYGDITDGNFLSNILLNEKPEELYHLAAQSFVGYSFQNALSTYGANIGGTLNVCNAVKDSSPDTRMYFAAASELFGQPKETPQNKMTPFFPRSPYAISKLADIWTVRTYREAYKVFMANGILFNHESEVRGPEFVTRKISREVARIYHGSKEPVVLGNLSVVKDWSYAKDYVEGMCMMLQQDHSDDFVLWIGESHTVREFVQSAFKEIGMDFEWVGRGVNEVGISDGVTRVKVSSEPYRPLESDDYQADHSNAEKTLGRKPKTSFRDTLKIKVKNDIDLMGLWDRSRHSFSTIT